MSELALRALLKEGERILAESQNPEASLDAWLLLEFVTGKDRAYYYAHSEGPVEEETAQRYLELIRKRGGHIPLQHLTHQAFFMGYEFYVDERVLVPRQDTEILVEETLKAMKSMENPRILDMCTGSGCILLSLLLEREDASGDGADISADALMVAEKNARSLGVEARARLIESDLFQAPCFAELRGSEHKQYDILVSNPPYIPTAEIEGLMEEVRGHDPRGALDGHEDGLYFYREITRQAKDFLREGGWLLYEIGHDQGEAVRNLLADAGYEKIRVIRDLSGLDRVVCGQRSAGPEQKQEEDHV